MEMQLSVGRRGDCPPRAEVKHGEGACFVPGVWEVNLLWGSGELFNATGERVVAFLGVPYD